MNKINKSKEDPLSAKLIIRQYSNSKYNQILYEKILKENKDFKTWKNSDLLYLKKVTEFDKDFLLTGQETQRNNLLDYTEFKDLEKEMVSITDDFFKVNNKLLAPKSYRLNTWANTLDKGSYHIIHSHPGTILVINYYVRCASDSRIIFFDHDMATSLLSYDQSVYIVDVKEGMMIASPPWIFHEVPPPTTNQIRVSLSTNVIEL